MIELASPADILEASVLVTFSERRGKNSEQKSADLILAGWQMIDGGRSWRSPKQARYDSLHQAWIDMRRQAKYKAAQQE